MTVISFKSFLSELSDKIQSVSDAYLPAYDEHTAFDYLIAELFETTKSDQFVFTDGPKDGGIDFYVTSSSSYVIAQCKCPDLELIGSSPQIYDQTPVDELRAAIEMILDKTGDYDVKANIKRLRGDYQRDKKADEDSTTLTALLAIMGSLSEPALKSFNSLKNSLRKERVFLKLIQWEDIYHSIHALEMPSDLNFEIQLHYDSENDLLSHRDYCYVLCHAFDLYEAFRKHEWNLFEWNVRYQIPNSSVNQRIVNALSKSKTRKLFHQYNNGLLITCKNYRKDNQGNKLTLVGPQIVNGCQTVRAICEAYESLSPEEQEKLRDETRAQVKVIRTTDSEFISELVISTNDQNPMNPRNLRSNTAEQRDISIQFRDLPQKWFYERKDGEFKSLLSDNTQVRWFRKSDYAVSLKKYRVIDNQDLAKTWLSFIGHSHFALRGGIDYFKDNEDGYYSRIFRSTPNVSFWKEFRHPEFEPTPEFFNSSIPSVYQYLFSSGIGSYVDYRRVPQRSNKLDAIKRGIRNGKIKGNAETGELTNPGYQQQEVDNYIGNDLEYNLNIMINNLRSVIIELYSYILCLKYDTLDSHTCQKLISAFPRTNEYFESGFDPSQLIIKQDGTSLLGPIYEFISDSLKQYYIEYKAELKASPRLKSYLAQRETINQIRKTIKNRNSEVAEYDKEWKLINKKFIESLPSIY